MRVAAHNREVVRRSGDLAGRIGVAELARIRPHDDGQLVALLVAGRRVQRRRQRDAVLPLVRDELMLDAAELRLRIRERRHRLLRRRVAVARVVVRRLGRRFIAREEPVHVVVERRHDRLVRVRRRAEQPLGLQRLQIQPIEERTIAFRRRSRAGEIDVVAGLHDRAATAPAAPAAVAARHRVAGILVRGILPAIPQLARLGARLEDPRPHVARRAIRFTQQRDAFFGERDPAEPPLRLRELGRLLRERRRHCDDLVAERNLFFEIAAVERFGPDDRGRLIRAPVISARPRLDAGERRPLAARPIGDLPRDRALSIPDLDVLGEAVHRDEVREGTLDRRDEEVLVVRRRRDAAENRVPPERRPRAGGDVDRGELAREVVLEQILVVRRLDHVLVGRRRRRLAEVLLDVRADRDGRLRRRGTAPGRYELAHDRRVVLQPVARVAGRRVDVIDERFRAAGRRVGDPQIDRVRLRVEEREMRAVRRELDVRQIRLRRHGDLHLAAVGDALHRDRVDERRAMRARMFSG